MVKVINDTFAAIGQPVLTADELLQEVNKHPEVWNVYARGFTMGCNQTEKKKTTERIMRFKPKNIVELAAFVAAIRPGAKTLVDGYVARTLHTYGIPAMDELLRLNGATGVTGQSSYLFFDEQILTLAQAAGIEPADAYALIKAIKKKKLDKVAAYKDKFVPGFIKYLKEQQNTDDTLAEKTANDVWSVILNSASYLFCAAHAYAMALDSLYGAYLKTIAPYEFYLTLLKLYTDKGNKDKISLIIQEMKRFAGINMTTGRFGEDNRDWYVDKENKSISQSISSIKYISKNCAMHLYRIRSETFNHFVELLRYLQMNTTIDAREIDTLIAVGYFSRFGGRVKLQNLANEFREGKYRIKKETKSWKKRLEELIKMEDAMPSSDLPIEAVAKLEYDLIGMCLSSDQNAPNNKYICQEVDDKYRVTVKLYSLQRGTSGSMRVGKTEWSKHPIAPGDIICVRDWQAKPKFVRMGDKWRPLEGDNEIWLNTWRAA